MFVCVRSALSPVSESEHKCSYVWAEDYHDPVHDH